MGKRLFWGIHSLRTQVIVSLVVLVVLTALAVGLPSIWLNHEQLNSQAWAQLDQGIRAARALYAARESEVSNLAGLTAQRPTLIRLLTQRDSAAFTAYLLDLQKGAGFDMVTVCDSEDLVVAYTSEVLLEEICQREEASEYAVVTAEGGSKVWLLATHQVSDESELLGKVIVGVMLDDAFALEMRAQTGLEHSLFLTGEPIATSMGVDKSLLAESERKLEDHLASDGSVRMSFDIQGTTYYAARLNLDEPSLDAEVALPAEEILAAQRRLAWLLAGGILAAAALASALGALLAGSIAKPLERLADSATRLNKDNLDFSLAVRTPVKEVSILSQTLEEVRIDLQKALTNLKQEKDWGVNLLESIVEGIVTLDDRHHVNYFSLGAEQVTGWERERALDRSIDEVFPLVDEEAPFSAQIPSPGERLRKTVRLANGRQATLAFTGAKLKPSEARDAQMAIVFRDVSEEEAVSQLLGRFLSNVAHEFRTPLSALAASVELLLDQAPDLNHAEIQELLTSLHLGVLALETLIDNLLESASIEARRFKVSPRQTDLRDIIVDAVQTMDPLLKKYDQRLALKIPAKLPLVRADPRRTAQVLINLLSNASKHGPSDAEIAIEVKIEGEWARVAVTDQGTGIPEAHIDDVFRRFDYPGTRNESAKAGAGLGLSVVKAIVDAQGGEVSAENCPNGGATFWFTIPIASEP